MLGDFKKTTKRNLLKGIPWRFGPNWPGKRCEAKTRKGTPCQRPANDITSKPIRTIKFGKLFKKKINKISYLILN